MPTVAFLNFGAHTHVLRYVYELCNDKDTRVLLFSDEDTRNILREEGVVADEEILLGDMNLYRYLSQVERICDKRVDYLLNVGMYTNIRAFLSHTFFEPNCVSLILINSANAWIGSGFEFSREFSPQYNIWANAKSAIKRRLLSNYTAILVEFDTVKKHVESKLNCPWPVRTFNPVIRYEEKTPNSSPETVRFVIPGNISRSRRDYDLVLDAFETAFANFPEQLELRLVGRLKDEDIGSKCDELREKGYLIDYYTDWVDSETFVREMGASDIILLPQNQYRKEALPFEVYGKTSGTGGVFEAIRHAKPILLPEHFPDVGCLPDSNLRYSNADDLENVLCRLVSNRKEVTTLKAKARANAERFSFEQQRERLHSILYEFD